MNLQHERMVSLCDTLALPFVAQGYGPAAQDAARTEMAYSDFLEGLLRQEAAGRKVRKQSMIEPPGRISGHQDAGGLQL
jgi:hypothetical protein